MNDEPIVTGAGEHVQGEPRTIHKIGAGVLAMAILPRRWEGVR
jgi:hypothetical protein